ncbi:thrombomodulin [Narcine bancroftii]|uniref:thrombomodulin n=1 Tax=Narcine bancroftii TaxID=1343680 RepID=UPI0038319043
MHVRVPEIPFPKKILLARILVAREKGSWPRDRSHFNHLHHSPNLLRTSFLARLTPVYLNLSRSAVPPAQHGTVQGKRDSAWLPAQDRQKMLLAWTVVCALVPLVQSDLQATERSAPSLCAANFCYSLQRERRKFNMARNICKSGKGDAMAVRSKAAAEIVARLLQSAGVDPNSQFWLGLQLHQKVCPTSTNPLRGYRWLDGDSEAEYVNWGSVSEACGPRCVTVSSHGTWMDRLCKEKADGVLCEHRRNDSCVPLEPGNGSVAYLTPLGGQTTELSPGTVAVVAPSGTRFQCNESRDWVPMTPAPWDCQVRNGGCDHVCQAGPPPSCSCFPGHGLKEDGRSCAPANPCDEERCDHHCLVQGNRGLCACRSGHRLDTDGKSCLDIDECESSPCDHDCHDTPGSFTCSCRDGYRLSGEGKCEDINECMELTKACAYKCHNTDGSFICSCKSGYEPHPQDRTQCVFYCQTEVCKADCYGDECLCPLNYILDDSTRMCHDEDECAVYCLGHHCVNTFGGFKCECKEGYELSENGLNCEFEGSGIPPTEKETLSTTRPPPHLASLSLGVVLGCIFAIAVLTLVFAGVGHHLLKKRGKWQTSTKYKSANTEQDVNLSQVSAGDDLKHQYSNDTTNVGT